MTIEIIFSSVVIVILTVMTVATMGYPPKARLFPLILLVITEGLVVIHLIKEIWGKTKHQTASAEEEKTAEKIDWAMYLRAPAWITGFMLSIYLLGYLVGASLFSFFYLKVHGEKWLTTIGFSLGVLALIYGGFEIALKTPLYGGLLFG